MTNVSDERWALVDVETSGLSPQRDRVLSVAVLTMDGDTMADEFTSLMNPGCDPGPVHVHGLTPERLRGAPTFGEIAAELHGRLESRTLVAHNAAFDHNFLAAEAARLDTALPTTQRLCTVALTRRLQLDVPNAKLSTLTRYWGIPHRRAHDAREDVLALAGVFRHSRSLAASLGLPLPVVACGATAKASPARATAARATRSPRTRSPYRNPGRLDRSFGLIQGMRVAITGALSQPRADVAYVLTAAGLDVTGSVSARTSVLVTNERSDSTKSRAAAVHGVPIIDESTLMRLLAHVRPGVAIDGSVVPTAPPETSPVVVTSARAVTPTRQGPMSGCRVLLIGGRHLEATIMRSRLIQLGALPAVNLTAGVTDVLILDGGEGDPRMSRIRERALNLLAPRDVDTMLATRGDISPIPAHGTPAAMVLPPGGVVDLPSDVGDLTVNVSWAVTADADIDVVAFETRDDDLVPSDAHFVFYNQPTGPTGATALTIDGDCEQAIRVDLSGVDESISRVVVGAAVDGVENFGVVGPLAVTIDGSQGTIASAVVDAATTERTMIVAEVYRRNARWRVRVVGQGYDDGLAELAVRYGVEVDD
ncbi:TerD family protein [Williamsia sp. M5A3_1d]